MKKTTKRKGETMLGEGLSEEGIKLISGLAPSEEGLNTLSEEDVEAVRKFAEAIKNLTHEQKTGMPRCSNQDAAGITESERGLFVYTP